MSNRTSNVPVRETWTESDLMVPFHRSTTRLRGSKAVPFTRICVPDGPEDGVKVRDGVSAPMAASGAASAVSRKMATTSPTQRLLWTVRRTAKRRYASTGM
jgi:hypothetical protein